ncbi:MAG: hypothetical protein M1833_004950 [Piccolia ochrophora]|nr:MAG: hypothetical protein M1833_004950 [Piccolia ochrophora]
MAGLYTFGTIVGAVLALIAAGYFFADVVIPACVYIVQYIRYGKTRAETDALDAMGENKASYVLKDQLKKNKMVDDSNINKLQDQLGDAAGSLVDKEGVGGGVAKGVSDSGGDLLG